jgi:hypothetical protein
MQLAKDCEFDMTWLPAPDKIWVNAGAGQVEIAIGFQPGLALKTSNSDGGRLG